MGTQCMIFNPICTVGFTYAGWKFFEERIPDEEEALHEFFGKQYEKYCEETPIRIPGLDDKSAFPYKAKAQ
jgi:protein-S-isoprenylcysteine O-methyltransferase